MIKRVIKKINEYFENSKDFTKYHKLYDEISEIKKYLDAEIKKHNGIVTILDVGGGDGKFIESLISKENINKCIIYVLDIENSTNRDNVILYDINKPIEQSENQSCDIVFSYNALEHFCEPHIACKNMISFLKKDGIIICSTVFSWRYHPVPDDYFRYTDSALRYLFRGLNEIECGYSIKRRRENIKGGYFGDKDIPPLDFFGGFRENWSVFFIGDKK